MSDVYYTQPFAGTAVTKVTPSPPFFNAPTVVAAVLGGLGVLGAISNQHATASQRWINTLVAAGLAILVTLLTSWLYNHNLKTLAWILALLPVIFIAVMLIAALIAVPK